jgi:hypothetical protein
MEAMACGLPVVCSIIGSTTAMIRGDIEGFLVPQADEAGLVAALAKLADDPDLRARMGKAARRRAVACFDRRVTANLLLQAIRASAREGPIALNLPQIWSSDTGPDHPQTADSPSHHPSPPPPGQVIGPARS